MKLDSLAKWHFSRDHKRTAPSARRLPGAAFRAIAATLIAQALVLSATESPTYAQTSGPVTSTTEPIMGGLLYATGTEITVLVLPAEGTFYTSELLLFDGESFRVLTTNHATGAVIPIPAPPSGTELLFGIRVLNTGQLFRTGPAERNPDNMPHATVQLLEPGRVRLAFEDVYGGGDRDFDDAIFELRGGVSLTQERPQDPEPNPTPTPKKAKKAKKSGSADKRTLPSSALPYHIQQLPGPCPVDASPVPRYSRTVPLNPEQHIVNIDTQTYHNTTQRVTTFTTKRHYAYKRGYKYDVCFGGSRYAYYYYVPKSAVWRDETSWVTHLGAPQCCVVTPWRPGHPDAPKRGVYFGPDGEG